MLISASAASQIGDWLYNAALLGYVFSATHSAAWVGAATISRLLPYVLLGPLGGAIADRHPRRTVLVAGSVLRLILMLVLAAVVAGDGPVALVIVVVALASAAGSAERPAALSLLPRLVGEGRLGPANALLHTVQDLAVVVGPAIGALLLTVAAPPAAFIANAGTFAVSALLFAMPQDGGSGGCRPWCHWSPRRRENGARHAVRDPALHRRGDGRVHLRGADRPAGHLRGPIARTWATVATGSCSLPADSAGSSARSSTVSWRRVGG